MEKLNFGPTIIGLIKTIYSKMSSRLMINGQITQTIDVTRSLRQGDGLSMILFLFISELLAQRRRQEQEISPIKLPNSKPKKLTQL